MSDHPQIPGEIHAEELIEYDGQDVTVYDRDVVRAECARCDLRWEPDTADDTDCPDCGHDDVLFSTSHVEQYDFADGRTIRVFYRPVIECEHCGNTWGTMSDEDRPSCSACHRRTDRNQVGKYYKVTLKHGLFSGDEATIDAVTDELEYYRDKFAVMQANGWTLDHTTSSQSFVLLSKGDVPPQTITA